MRHRYTLKGKTNFTEKLRGISNYLITLARRELSAVANVASSQKFLDLLLAETSKSSSFGETANASIIDTGIGRQLILAAGAASFRRNIASAYKQF